MLHSALINVMVKAARRAGRSLKRDLGEIENLQVSLKGPANFVSLADKRAEEMLYTDLSKARPGQLSPPWPTSAPGRCCPLTFPGRGRPMASSGGKAARARAPTNPTPG